MTALELINKMIPEHDRSRCITCSMLKVVEMGNDLPDNFDFHKVIYG